MCRYPHDLPQFQETLNIACPVDMFSLSHLYPDRLMFGQYYGVITKLSPFGSPISPTPGIFKGPIICDKANRGFVSNSPIWIFSKPPNPRSFATELIECARSTTTGLSRRIPSSISIFSFPNHNSDNVLFRKQALPKPRNAYCISHA